MVIRGLCVIEIANVSGVIVPAEHRILLDMPINIHGAKDVAGRRHPVLDIRYWEGEFPLRDDDRDESYWIDCPGKLALREQAIRRAKTKGDLGPSVPADVFVWSEGRARDHPWLTRIGGWPWRPKGKRWPRDDNGVPLAFLGQICFADSADVLPCKLPGEVALIFGTNHCGWISITDGCALEWSPLDITEPEDGMGVPWTGELPYVYQGVLHRTAQYTDWKIAEAVFKTLGYKEGGFQVRSVQATSIGTHASLPQGWPFEKGDGNTLIATLSSFYFRGKWPLCDIPSCLQQVSGDGQTRDLMFDRPRDFGVGDAGCIWIYQNKAGEFKLDEACG